MQSLSQSPASPLATLFLLSIAALLEVLGDSFLQSALHRSSGVSRLLFFTLGGALLTFYGIVVNLPDWNFGRLLGVYVVFFFLAAQIVARVRFQQIFTLPVIVGGGFIVTGGLIISLWRV